MNLRFILKLSTSILFIVMITAFSSCVKEKVEIYDYSCYVNGQLWQMNNPGIVITRNDYRVVASHDIDNRTELSVDLYPDEGKEVIINALHLDVTNFHGAGKYDQ